MNSLRLLAARSLPFTLLSLLFATVPTFAQQPPTANLRGQVTDNFKAAIVGATVIAADANGVEKTVITNDEGVYIFNALPPGLYTVRATAPGFTAYENATVNVVPGRREPFNIQLSAGLEREEITVAAEGALSTDPTNNADTVVLRGQDLDALPDDPDDLAAALQALAGPSAGPNGGQIFIDGFTGGRLPPRESIREVRFNQNPFSAENDRPGGGRIEILTKPGTDKFRGSAFMNFTDEALNSRNPFAPNRAPYQERNYGGNVSGPIISKRFSFFLDFERREADDNELVNATILDPSYNINQFSLAVLTPQRRLTFSPRFDYQINQNNTLVGRYSYNRSSNLVGIGNFSLVERAYNTAGTQHTFQLTETAVLSQSIVNETRFQYVKERRQQNGDNALPTINVQDAFTGGGSQIGLSSNDEDRIELQNYTTFALGLHSVKAGGRLRSISINDISPQNFGGTFLFAGGVAPVLDANNQVMREEDGRIKTSNITSIARYQRTLLLEQQGLSPSAIRALGGGLSQFSISGGDPAASVSQVDFGGFIQDDWRIRPDLTLNFGLRYETQNNISSNLNFAPRVGFAYSPGASGNTRAKTVFRGGFGIFYDRFSENFTLQATRYNGINQQRFVVTDPLVLDTIQFGPDRIPNVPSTDALQSFAQQQAVTRVTENLQSPYSIFAGFIFEQQLPKNFTLFTFINTIRSRHLLRLRNVNAPLPGTFVPRTPGNPGSPGVRPLGDLGDIYQYESSGISNTNRMIVGVRNQLNRNFSLFANYFLGKAKSDVDTGFGFGGGGSNPSFPADNYDLSNEYGRANSDARHNFFLGGNVNLPYGFNLNPFVIANSGNPFNIVIGRDINGDRQFTERPAIATDLTRPSVVVTDYGTFDTNPLPNQQIIPRNFGQGPGSFTVNLSISKRFGFGTVPGAAALAAQSASTPQGGGQPGGGGRGGRGPGGPGGGGGPFGQGPGGGPEKRYNLALSIQVRNLFNHVNPAPPNGNLSSTFFGQSLRTGGGFGGGGVAGNRVVQAQLRFSF
ncbi:MAG: TonB-dependent receptor [Pyrinomonadaceae bacterium]|nr:TonB-dependent receptor [Pyrinomonadaceae bacterium]